jgi:microcompartment protein CcmL/EutN
MSGNVYSLGMIETFGFPALVAAADAAAKAADVRVVTYEGADAGIVTIYMIGDVSSVQAAVAIGAAEAKRVGRLLHAHVIARPDQSVPQMILRLLEQYAAAEQADGEDAGEPAVIPYPDPIDLQYKSVAELRKMARAVPNFPLSPQEISSAKKEELIQCLMDLENERGDKME